MKYVLILLLATSQALAGITDNQFETKLQNEQVSIIPKKDFHLNKDAPASIQIEKNKEDAPVLKTEKAFSFSTQGLIKKAIVNFYVCDDKKTVCEKQEVVIDKTDAVITSNELKTLTSEEKSTIVKKTAEHKGVFNSIQEVQLKSQNSKPTIIVFSAPWCPPCLRMMTETYNQKVVQKQLKTVNFFKVNTDLAENYELSEKFKVKSIPTIVLLDATGEETHRWLDYQPAVSFAQELQKEIKIVGQAMSLVEKAKTGDIASARALGSRAYYAADYAEAIKWLSYSKDKKDLNLKLASEIGLAEANLESDEKKAAEPLQALEKAISLTSSQVDKIRWSVDYYQKKSDANELSVEAQAKALQIVSDIDLFLKQTNKKIAEDFLNSTYGDYTGFEKFEMIWLKSQIYKMTKQESLLKKTYTDTLSMADQVKTSVQKPGEILMLVSYLREAGEIKKVENFYEQLIKKYPKTYVYYEKYARFSLKNKQLDKADKLSNESLEYPEGNRNQLVLLRSQILKELNKKAEALKLVNEALQDPQLQHKKFVRTLKKLNDLKKDLTEIK